MQRGIWDEEPLSRPVEREVTSRNLTKRFHPEPLQNYRKDFQGEERKCGSFPGRGKEKLVK